MPCILWLSCDCSSGELVDKIGIEPYKIIEKGSTVATRAGDKYYDQTVCGFDVSKGDFTDFKTLVDDSIKWLTQHFENLRGVGGMVTTAKLDYGYYSQFVDSKIVAQYDTIPYKLMKLASELKMDIELSQYWYSEDQGAQLN